MMSFVIPSTIGHDGPLLSLRWLNTCLPLGRGELTPWLDLFSCVASPLPTELFLSQATSFITFTLPILSFIPVGKVSEQLCGAELTSGV